MTKKKETSLALLFAIVGTLTALACVTSVQKPFLWDDIPFILQEQSHRSLADIPSFFFQDQHLLYRPIREVAYSVTYAFFGLSPVAHRLAAILFHVVATLLSMAIVLTAGGSRRTALIAGLIFGLHPVHVDRSAFTTAAFDNVGPIFGYAAIAFLLRYLRAERAKDLALGLILIVPALFGSEECAAYPLLLFAWAWIFEDKLFSKKNLAAFIPLIVILALYLAARTAVIGQFSRVDVVAPPPLAARILTSSVVLWHEFAKVIFPFSIRPDYYTRIRTSLDMPSLVSLTALAVCAGWILKKRGSRSWPAFGIAWFFLALAPYSNIIPIEMYMAERYLYTPLLGLAIPAAHAIDRSGVIDRQGIRASVARVCLYVCTLLMAAFSLHRGWIYSDSLRLWNDAIRKDDRSPIILMNYADQVTRRGVPIDPCPIFKRSLLLNPDNVQAHVGLGQCAVERGDREAAFEHFMTAYRKGSDKKGALEGLSQLMILNDDLAQAEQAAAELLVLDPGSGIAHYVLGFIAICHGDDVRAKTELDLVLSLVPPTDFKAIAARAWLEQISPKTEN